MLRFLERAPIDLELARGLADVGVHGFDDEADVFTLDGVHQGHVWSLTSSITNVSCSARGTVGDLAHVAGTR